MSSRLYASAWDGSALCVALDSRKVQPAPCAHCAVELFGKGLRDNHAELGHAVDVLAQLVDGSERRVVPLPQKAPVLERAS